MLLTKAPAKINLCLYLGAVRGDGLHELCSVFTPLSLVDLIDVEEADEDQVVCPGIESDNLATWALAALRKAGWSHPPIRIEIKKRIPVGAGLGGGSADAAAVLRLARGQVDGLEQIAMVLGADVPSQLVPATSLVEGAGESVRRLPSPRPFALLLLPGGGGLSTAEVFDEADRLGPGRGTQELAALSADLHSLAGSGAGPLSYRDLLVNDLEPAAISLRPQIAEDIEALEAAGAQVARMTGSGSTVFGIFESRSDAIQAGVELRRDDAIICDGGVSV